MNINKTKLVSSNIASDYECDRYLTSEPCAAITFQKWSRFHVLPNFKRQVMMGHDDSSKPTYSCEINMFQQMKLFIYQKQKHLIQSQNGEELTMFMEKT